MGAAGVRRAVCDGGLLRLLLHPPQRAEQPLDGDGPGGGPPARDAPVEPHGLDSDATHARPGGGQARAGPDGDRKRRGAAAARGGSVLGHRFTAEAGAL